MQVSKMAAIQLLRSQMSLLYPSKFKLILPLINSLIIHNQQNQNPKFSRHFRTIHSSTLKSSSESSLIDVNGASKEPASEFSTRGWSTFSNLQSKPTNSIKRVNFNEEEGSRNRVYSLSSSISGKSKAYWVCSDCGHSTAQWWNTCKSCNKFGTLKKFSVSENVNLENMMKSSWLPEQILGRNAPVRLMDVNRGMNHMEWRIRLSGLLGLEINTVLGGGIVPGSLILVGGDPGVGKSTLALQMAALIAVSCDVGGAAPVLYISGEESVEQIGNRADRLSIDTEDLFLYSSTDIKDILEQVQLLSPRAVVVDSIQTVYLKGVTGSPGGLMQVKECTSALLRFAKKTNIPVLLIGHVNKNGEIAGPRVLEHIVDVVLYMEGEKHSSHRLLRSVKNRFGSTDELGVFEMSESGLEAVSNPSEMFLSAEHSDSEHLAGLAIAVIIDGSRSFLVEVQALCVSGPGVSRHVNGVQPSRADMILTVLKKQAGLKLDDHCILLNVISGVSLTDTSGDLAVAAAICSRHVITSCQRIALVRIKTFFLEFPLPNNVAFIGEIGLSGELRMVPRIEKRVITLAKLGYKKCVVPKSAGKALAAISSEIQIIGCKNLEEVIDKVFRRLD
ncbi:hypothetical protein KSS87_021431 [Heliosperma pusillum]|nr:hypothetical protein KSS87_021431 [Heliosperma pusillum]